MEKNIASNNISVIPSNRVNVSNNSIAEMFLTIIRQLVDADSFVITKCFNPKDKFELNIHGYYFSINLGECITKPFSGATELFAYIRLPFKTLNVDDEKYYKGLIITNTLPNDADSNNVFGLRILYRKDKNSDWIIPDEAKVKFGYSSIGNDT